MKNIFTLLLGGLLTTTAFANNITLTFPNNRNYQVMIDGRDVNGYNYSNNTIYLNNLQYGQHSIEVYRMKKNGRKNNLVYSSSFNSSPQYDLNINIDNNGRVQMYQSRSNDYGRNGGGNNKENDNNGRWGKHKARDRDNDDGDRDYRGNNGGYNNGDYNHGGYDNGSQNNNRYNQAISDYDFNQLVQKIRSQWIGKMSTARDAMNNNYFNTY